MCTAAHQFNQEINHKKVIYYMFNSRGPCVPSQSCTFKPTEMHNWQLWTIVEAYLRNVAPPQAIRTLKKWPTTNLIDSDASRVRTSVFVILTFRFLCISSADDKPVNGSLVGETAR